MINNRCEQFRAFNRIEGLTATETMDEALRAELYDPLWMMGRQQQFGEFYGNDCGTAVTVKISHEMKSLSLSDGGKPFNFKNEPPEARIEAVKPVLGTFEGIEAGTQFLKLIGSNGVLKAQLLDYFTVVIDSESLEAIDGYEEMLFCFGSDLLDGVALYHAIKEADERLIDLLLDDDSVALFIEWFEGLYGGYLDQYNNWVADRLEYQAEFTIDQNSSIVAKEYFSGNLEWYNFDFREHRSRLKSPSQIKEYLPTKLTYPGMPSDRWWEIEDESVDFINISADQTDIAKLVVSEFSALYSNDWLVTPLDVSYGSVCRVKSALIKDTFGEYSYVPNKITGNAGKDWDLFSMYNDNPDEHIDGLVLFPSIHKVEDSAAIEQVTFKRDEMANMAWGVEEVISNNMGGSLSGHSYASQFTLPEREAESSADLTYSLMSPIPFNWIPFVPVRTRGSISQIKLKRGMLPDPQGKKVIDGIEPKTALLMPEVGRSQYLQEEEILKGGITVTGSYQRTRWYNGKTINWYGYKKVPGKSLKESGMKLDYLQKTSRQE
ncbi:MAG: hypothetical protein OCC49_15335 [Fibrobacterales bacterium]